MYFCYASFYQGGCTKQKKLAFMFENKKKHCFSPLSSQSDNCICILPLSTGIQTNLLFNGDVNTDSWRGFGNLCNRPEFSLSVILFYWETKRGKDSEKI